MCFSIPLKVRRVIKTTATLEDGRKARFKNMNIKSGDFVQVTGDIIIGKMSQENGKKIRSLIKRLNS